MTDVHEEWRDVKGYEGRYQVSNLGRVRSMTRKTGGKWHIHNPPIDSKGYPQVFLWKENKHHCRKVHVIIAETFIGPRPDGMTIDHINGDKTDNRPANLEYVTNAENGRRFRTSGRPYRQCNGERSPLSKLTEEKVRIGVAMAKGGATQQSIANKLGVTKNTIGWILRGGTWKHLDLKLPHARH